MMRKLSFFLLMAAAVSLLPSCASDQPKQDADSQVSTIPWDRPEKWENGSNVPGASMMGTR